MKRPARTRRGRALSRVFNQPTGDLAVEQLAATPSQTLLLTLLQQSSALQGDVKLILQDRATMIDTHREMAKNLGDLDMRLARMESVTDKIEPVVWQLETDRQRGIGARALLTRGRILWTAFAGAAGAAVHWLSAPR